jgi:hypothetical protein
MTEEEARALGWEGAELREYLKGRDLTEAWIDALPRPQSSLTAPEPEAPRPDPDNPAYRSWAVGRALEAQSAATLAAQKAQQAAMQPAVIVTDLPSAEPSVYERRQWALQQALIDHPPVLRPGGEPRADVAFKLPDGTTKVVQNMPPLHPLTVIRPSEWEAHQARWEFRQRQQENELLCRAYGLEQCLEAGFLTELEASFLDPERIRPVPQLPGAPR